MITTKGQLNRWLCARYRVHPEQRTTIYDRLPLTRLLWIALRSGKLKIEVDYARMARGRTGFIYKLHRTRMLSSEDFIGA